jgi:hypothetical protein
MKKIEYLIKKLFPLSKIHHAVSLIHELFPPCKTNEKPFG